MMFLAIFLSLVCWMDLILLVVIVINVLEHLVMTVIQVVSRTDVEPTVYRVTVGSSLPILAENRAMDSLAFRHECSL